MGLTARREADLVRLAADRPAFHVAPADVTDRAAVHAAHSAIDRALGSVALLVANAGIYLPVDAHELDAERFRRSFDVNLMGVVHAVEAVMPGMVERRQGHIHIVSSATAFGGMPTAAAYGATKAALYNFAETLKIELERFGVGVSVSTPGFVATPAQDENSFPRPFEISAETAAKRIADGVARGGFEITFPRRFTWPLRAIYALPPAMRLPLVRRATGWDKIKSD